MDLRLPSLPDLLPPNLMASAQSGSIARADSSSHGQGIVPQESLPPYLEKLLLLQKLQDQAFGSSPSEHLVPAPSSSNQQHASLHALSEISGADLAPRQSLHSSIDQNLAAAFASTVSSSFLEVDEQYLTDPPLLELDGNSVSASPTATLQQLSDAPPATVVPAGIVAQRRKSFTDHAASSVYQRPPFVPEVRTDTVTSAGYVKSIAQNSRSSANDAGFVASVSTPASGSDTLSLLTKGGAVELAYPFANEPSSNLAPPPNLHFPSPPQLNRRSQDLDVLQQLAETDALSEDMTVSQLEQLSAASLKEFFIKVVDMMDSANISARSRAMVALCNFLSKGKGRDKINLDGLSTLLPKLLCFLPADRSSVLSDAELYLAGATSGTICNLSNSSSIRKQCCDMGFLQRLIALISQNEVFSTRHASGALWNLVVDNDDAKLLIGSDELFRAKLAELFTNSDHQVSKHALGLASEMCCRNVQVKELFCDERRMQLLISIVRECSDADVSKSSARLRSCCLLICNVLANSPVNKSIALKLGLFDVVLPLLQRSDPELCAVIAGIIVNLPPWQQFRNTIKLSGLFPVIQSHTHSTNQSLARNTSKLIDWLAISKKHKKPFFVKAPTPVNLKMIFGGQ